LAITASLNNSTRYPPFAAVVPPVVLSPNVIESPSGRIWHGVPAGGHGANPLELPELLLEALELLFEALELPEPPLETPEMLELLLEALELPLETLELVLGIPKLVPVLGVLEFVPDVVRPVLAAVEMLLEPLERLLEPPVDVVLLPNPWPEALELAPESEPPSDPEPPLELHA
jgi:hypothetical protein